jgi:hypothetical protein
MHRGSVGPSRRLAGTVYARRVRAWDVEDHGDRIVVRFGVHVSAEDGKQSARRFLEVMGERGVHLVLDLRETRGYESDARKAWQSALWPVRDRITRLTVASRSAVPRMGASMFAAFLGIPCELVDELPR